MPIFECAKCSAVNVPNDWTGEKKSEIASFIRKTSPIFAVQNFHPIEMGLKNAKSIFFHITKVKGHCHHCKTELVEFEGNCPKCKRLNLDW